MPEMKISKIKPTSRGPRTCQANASLAFGVVTVATVDDIVSLVQRDGMEKFECCTSARRQDLMKLGDMSLFYKAKADFVDYLGGLCGSRHEYEDSTTWQ